MTEEKMPNALQQLPIKSVSGSSSGAIAATVMTLMPHRLEEYTDRFLQDRGHAFKNLRETLLEEAFQSAKAVDGVWGGGVDPKGLKSSGPVLSICTTRCSDGGIELFSFGGRLESNQESDETTKRQQGKCYKPLSAATQFVLGGDEEKKHHERLLKAIEASCRIPRSFHPIDMVALNYKYLLHQLPNTRDTYPKEEGIEIDGKGYVDGGIAAPFPPTPLDGDPSCTGRIVVSPIAGEYFYKTDNNFPQPVLKAIRPENDTSWKAPLIDSVTLFGSGCTDDDDESAPPVAVRASPSLQNLRVLTTAMGMVSASPNDNDTDGEDNGGGGVLRDWYERGQADAHEMLNKF
jgi:predicted acylesterase/phospholipase RssA